MKMLIVNNGVADIPISSEDGGGWAARLPAGVEYAIDNPDLHTVFIGNHPGFEEAMGDSRSVLDMWRDHMKQWRTRSRKRRGKPEDPVVSVAILNEGNSSLFGLLSETKSQFEILPGHTEPAESTDYVQITDYEP